MIYFANSLGVLIFAHLISILNSLAYLIRLAVAQKKYSVRNSLKLVCWGFFSACAVEIQRNFAKTLSDVIVENGICKLWLRYAGMNEFALSALFDAIEKNQCFEELKLQRALLNQNGKCLIKLGNVCLCIILNEYSALVE